MLISGIVFATSDETKFAFGKCSVDNNGFWHNHEGFVLLHVKVYQEAFYIGIGYSLFLLLHIILVFLNYNLKIFITNEEICLKSTIDY